MARLSLPIAMAIMLTLHSLTAAAGESRYSGLELSGDIITVAVPALTYWIIHKKDDGEGEGQFLRSHAVSLLINTTLRYSLNEDRPNGHPYGFPSGHTAFMTTNAAFLQDRYGWEYGLPAYALTAYVAWVRVDTDHHRWRDIVAGAALSYGVSKLFVTPDKATYIAPVVGPDWLGLRWERSF